MIGFVIATCTVVGALVLGIIFSCWLNWAWSAWKERKSSRQAKSAMYTDPRRHEGLRQSLLSRDKVGSFNVIAFEVGRTDTYGHHWVQLERPLHKDNLLSFLRGIDPIAEHMRDTVIVEWNVDRDEHKARLHFAFPDPADAMLFKLANGGTA